LLADRSAKAGGGLGGSISDLTTRLDAVLSDDSHGDRARAEAATRRLVGIAGAQRETSQLMAGILKNIVEAAERVQLSSADTPPSIELF